METSESEEDNFEEGLDFQDQDESIAGIRRRLSDEATVSRVGEALNRTLGADRDEEATPRDHFSPVQVRFPVNAPAFRPQHEEVVEGQVVGGAGNPKVGAGDNSVAAMPDPPAVVNFDVEDGADGATATTEARQIKLEFNIHDIRFWFAQLEDEMVMSSVKSQWLKKTVLQRNLPIKQKEDVKAYLVLQKEQAGRHIYLDIKTELLRLYAPKPQESYKKALTRTMVGLPSQLGYQLINDVCKAPPEACQLLLRCTCPSLVV